MVESMSSATDPKVRDLGHIWPGVRARKGKKGARREIIHATICFY
jgi:hypothetical protein